MYKILKIAAAAALLGITFGCSSEQPNAKRAREILAQVKELKDAGQYYQALDLIDTLNISCRECVAQRREAVDLKREMLISLTEDSIAADEAIRPALTDSVEKMKSDFIEVKTEGTRGFFVHKDAFKGNETAVTGIQARIDDQGYFFIIANVASRKIGLQGLRYGNVTTLPYECIATPGGEMISLMQEYVSDFAQALAQAPAGAASITLYGTKGDAKVKLSAAQVNAFRKTWQYAQAAQHLRSANIQREKLERRLDLLNSHTAQDTPEQ